MTDEALMALTLPWAKEHAPDAYEATLAVSQAPAKFRRYMVRLIELQIEREGVDSVPLRAVELTGTVIRMRTPAGREIVVQGAMAGAGREWTFAELADLLDAGVTDLDEWAATKEAFDLVTDDGQFNASDRALTRRNHEAAVAQVREDAARNRAVAEQAEAERLAAARKRRKQKNRGGIL
jgi:hypothetical protein